MSEQNDFVLYAQTGFIGLRGTPLPTEQPPPKVDEPKEEVKEHERHI